MNKQRIILFLLLSAALWGLPRRASAQIFAVRANALAACSATLNVGAETALTDNWSLELSGYWNPVQTASLSMNFHAVQLGSRYWFYESFVGHFIGQHLTYAGYDLGSRTKRYKGNAYGLGVSYGYAWMLSKRWNVAVEAGVGKTRGAILRSEIGTMSISTTTDAGRWHPPNWKCRFPICFSHELLQ